MTLSVAISSLGNINSVSAGAESSEVLCTKKWFKGTCKSTNCLWMVPKNKGSGKEGCHSLEFFREQIKDYKQVKDYEVKLFTIDQTSSGEEVLKAARIIGQASKTRCGNECLNQPIECHLSCGCSVECIDRKEKCRELCANKEEKEKPSCFAACEEKRKICNEKVCGVSENRAKKK